MMEQVATPAPSGLLVRVLRRIGAIIDALASAPRTVLAVLIATQIALTVVFALSVTHNGWAWYQGGDQIWYSTDGWLLGQLVLPAGEVGYSWPLILAPITWFTGPTWLQAMPAIAVLNVAVLGPVGLLCVYGIATRLAGRMIGLLAALLWVVAPYAAIPLWVDRYHERWVDQFVPQGLGLSALADYPSMVLLLLAAWLLLRAIDARSWTDAAAAGLVVGYAGAMKPPNLLFLAGAGLAILLAGRWREGAVFAIALAPALLTLLLWKQRGLGSIPLFSLGESHQAADVAGLSVDRYVDLDWGHWKQQMSELREFFRAARLVQWAPIAGAIALALVRRWAGMGLLVGWLGAFLLAKGTSPLADIEAGSFFRLLMPAWPAYLLLVATLPLLVPTLPRRLGGRLQPQPAVSLRWRWLVAAVLALAVVPALVVGLAPPLQGPEKAVIQKQATLTTILTPVDNSIAVQTRRNGASQVITWRVDHAWRADVTYVVLRTLGPGSDVSCSQGGVTRCALTMIKLGTTRSTSFVDGSPPRGVTYRIGVATDYRDRLGGDMFAFSAPVRAAP